MSGTTFKQIDVLADQPDITPAHWHILNAPRPLFGHKTWKGEFRNGVHYAGVAPDGEHAAEYLRENRMLDAVLLRFVTYEDVKLWADNHLAVNGYGMTASEFTIEECWQSYCASGAGSREVEI